MLRITSTILLIALITSCSNSLVYSPSVNLTNQPLKEKEVDLQGGLEMLPETRPEELSGIQSTLGINGQLSYGFTDKLSMSLKGWADIENRENVLRSGYSLNGQFLKILSENKNFIILPRIGIALNGSDIEGYGIGTTLLYQNVISEKVSWYGGLGFLWGFRYLEKQINLNNEEKRPMGFGIIGNIGIGYQLSNSIRFNCELSPILQVNSFDENSQIILSPTFGIGYTLKGKNIE